MSSGELMYIIEGYSLAAPVIVDSQNVLCPILDLSSSPIFKPTLQYINMVTGANNWSVSAGDGFFCSPAFNDDTVYVGNDDGNLYALDLASGSQLWTLQLDGSQVQIKTVFDPGSGLVFSLTANGGFFAIDPVGKTIKWKFQPGVLMFPAVIVGGTVFTAGGSNLWAFDAATGATQWTQTLSSGVSSPLAEGDGLIFVGCSDGTLRALNQSSGTQAWSYQMHAHTQGRAAYEKGWVYAGDTAGYFYAHPSDPQSTSSPWTPLQVNSYINTGIATKSGFAYFGALDSKSNGYFYVIDVGKGQTANPVALTDELVQWMFFDPTISFDQLVFCAQSQGAELFMIDVGLLAGPDALAALPLQPVPRPTKPDPLDSAAAVGMLEMASFTSQLIVDTYDVSGATPTPTTPAFQMMLNLMDENKAPQTSSKVSVWASEPVTITVGQQSFSIGTDYANRTVVPANTAGQLAMTIAGSLGTASLNLQPDYFLSGFYLTVYPDTGNMQTLSKLQASDLDPTTAVGYDGQPILQPAYQDVTSRTSIASAISNTIGGQPQQTTLTAAASLTNDPPSRPYQPGAVPSFTVDFSSGITFTPGTSDQMVKAFSSPNGIGEFLLGDGVLGFLDFINSVVNGAEKIGSIVWQFANGVATAIVNGVENIYHFIVQSVDQAVQVVTAIFKQVVTDISKVVEWLSYLFSWDDIVNTHLLIKNQVLTTITGFQKWIDNELLETTNDVDTFFTNAETNALTYFDQLIKNLGGQSVSGVRKTAGDPNAAFTSSGQDVTTQANWLPRKFSENAGGTSLSALTATVTGDSTVLIAIEAFFTNVGSQIGNNPALKSLPGDLKTAFTNFAQLFTGSAGFNGQTLADVLAVVRDLVAGLIHLGQVVVDSFLKLLQAIIDGIVSFLTAPIQIPFLSDFYQGVAGDPLSVLSLFSLIVAVPTTIVYKLVTGSAPGSSPTAAINPAQELCGMANTFALLLLMPLWIAADLSQFPPVINGAIAAASALQAALVLALTVMAHSASPDYVLWVFQFFSVVLAYVGAQDNPTWPATAPTIYGAYGFGMMVIYIFMAQSAPSTYWDPDGEPFFINVCSALPYLGQPLNYIQVAGVGPAAVSLVDTVGFGVSAALSTILFWSGKS